MAIARDNSAKFLGTATGSFTCIGSNLILFCSSTGSGTMSATYNGVSMTLSGTQLTVGGVQLALFFLLNPATGSHTLTVTNGSQMAAASYTGVKQTGQPDNTGSNTAASTTSISHAISTVADNCWIFAQYYNNGGGTFSSSSNFNNLVDTNDNQTLIGDTGPVTPASSVTQSVTSSSSGSIGFRQFSFSPAPAVPSSAFLMFM